MCWPRTARAARCDRCWDCDCGASAFFEPASNPGGTILIHKQPDDIWRLDYQLRDDESDEDAVKELTIRTRVQAILTDIGHVGAWDLEWWSVYTANTLCLDEYRHGRIFFIGDSAHIVPIFGVRGLNNGLADAHNIGWKLAMVLNGEAGAPLLDSYSPERRGATLDVFANATKSTRRIPMLIVQCYR
jgi:3-(3-hydroxy-phenyl)propionate hydroxylase